MGNADVTYTSLLVLFSCLFCLFVCFVLFMAGRCILFVPERFEVSHVEGGNPCARPKSGEYAQGHQEGAGNKVRGNGVVQAKGAGRCLITSKIVIPFRFLPL